MNTNTTDHGPTVEGYEVVELVPAQDVAALVAERDRMKAALESIIAHDPYRQSSAGIIARAAIAKATGE